MPLESINCTNCGSGDVKEVKPSTYFCNHCETVFKHVDPTRVTLEQAFCGCGSAIQVRCNLCHVGLCGQCDAKQVRDYYYCKSSVEVLVRTEGFGYVTRDTSNPGLCLAIGNRVLFSSRGHYVFGPFIPTNKLLWCLPDHGVRFHHLCWSCVSAMVPVVAELMSSRRMCENLYCVRQPTRTCRCCGGVLCEMCLTMLDRTALKKADVCANCVMEHYPNVLTSLPRPPESTFGQARTRWGQLRALKAHDEALRRHNQQLPDVWAQVYALHSKGPCQRDRLVYEGLPADATSFDGDRPFRVLDERPSTPAVALSAVTTYP